MPRRKPLAPWLPDSLLIDEWKAFHKPKRKEAPMTDSRELLERALLTVTAVCLGVAAYFQMIDLMADWLRYAAEQVK